MLSKKLLSILLLITAILTVTSTALSQFLPNRDKACAAFGNQRNFGLLCRDWIPLDFIKNYALEGFVKHTQLKPSPIASFTEKTLTTSGEEVISQYASFSTTGQFIQSLGYDQHGTISSQYNYDAQGNLVESMSYKNDGSLSRKTLDTYDEEGNQTESLTLNPDGSIDVRITTSFDSNGERTEYAYYDRAGLRFQDTWIYDEKGKLIEHSNYTPRYDSTIKHEYIYDESGNLLETTECRAKCKSNKHYRYDLDNNLIEEAFYTSEDNISILYKYRYNQSGHLIEESAHYSDGSIGKHNTYSYDSQNRLVEESYGNPKNQSNETKIYSFDMKGNLEAKAIYYSSMLNEISDVKYDEYDNPIQSLTYNFSRNSSFQRTCNYEYDAYLNWTKRICSSQSTSSTPTQDITLRIFEYYE